MYRATAIVVALLTCAGAANAIEIVNAFPNLSFNLPVDIQNARDGSNRLFVVDKDGRIWVFDNHPDVTSKTAFLDIRDRVDADASEEGLLGLAFHPVYPDSPYVYVNYTTNQPTTHTQISRFTVTANPDSADDTSELSIMEVPKPFSNHNAGALAFGTDGYLYIGTGDGGGAGDPNGNGQNRTTLLGSILRIDVDNPQPPLNYGIPPNNPYAGNVMGYREEIWAYGFRNPWRLSIDPPTSRVWVGDVGQSLYEEIDTVTAGGNYGWNIMEGEECYQIPNCDTTGKEYPVWWYSHGCCSAAVTGGYVYHAALIPEWIGKYVCADYQQGTIWTIELADTGAVSTLVSNTDHYISSFGLDEGGNLYFCSYLQGQVYRFMPTVTAIDEPTAAPLLRERLGQNVPNPFNPRTSISFVVEQTAHVEVLIYDVRGALVRSLVGRHVGAGPHEVEWDARDSAGRPLPSGVYFYTLRADGRNLGARRMVLLK